MLRTRSELLKELSDNPKLSSLFSSWKPAQQEEFLDFCSGARGVKMLYDSFFKEIMNPEYVPERLEELLSLLLGEQVIIVQVLPNDSVRIADIPLDIFRKKQHNKPIRNKLDAWLTFFSMDEPEMIIQLITSYPDFKPMYEEIYELCRNTEKVMGMFSKELQELDRNTVQYMIDVMQDTINEKDIALKEKDIALQKNAVALQEKDTALQKKEAELQTLREQLAKFQEQNNS